jgi:3-deoxy-D-manno-octulosonic-acid transferase
MLWLYRLLFLPALVIASPHYLLRMKRRGGYTEGFSQRFGALPPLPPKKAGVRRVWLQAVSVGEMLAIAPLLESLAREPGVEVYLTTTTSTGYALARERYTRLTVGIGYFPTDAWPFSARAWRGVRPDLVILTEGERWPEHIHQAARRGVPVVCVNARLSDRSFRRMRAGRLLLRPLLRGITRLLACSELDAARFRELGFPADAVTTTGNIKLDLTLPALAKDEKRALREELGLPDGLLLLGSSTWPGEEAALLAALRAARARGLACRLLIVPRHAERRAEVEAEVKASGFSHHLRSRGKAERTVDVAVADTTGELRRLAQLADLVFVGKSLPPHDQGQTPVEAAALAKPIVVGPGMTNFRAIVEELKGRGAVREVQDREGLAATVCDLLASPVERDALALAAADWHRANQGAVERTMAALRQELSRAAEPAAL